MWMDVSTGAGERRSFPGVHSLWHQMPLQPVVIVQTSTIGMRSIEVAN
jgi:hypothetical protein